MARKFTEESFWKKLSDHAANAGRDVVLAGLQLCFAAIEKKTPMWARGVAFAALAYFVCPIDAVPDVTPVIGYADDAGVLAAALASLRAYVTAEITRQATARLKAWFA